jgi:hypothetical protein
MSFRTIQYHFYTVLLYLRIFSGCYCILLSKNTVVQNLEFRKIQLYRTNYCEIMMHVESGSLPIKSSICSLPMWYRLYKWPHHDSCCWVVNTHTTTIEEERKLTIKHDYSLCYYSNYWIKPCALFVDENTLHTCKNVFTNKSHPFHLSASSKCFPADHIDVVDVLPSAERTSCSKVFHGSLHRIFFFPRL